jgi:parallel beta-helix repeat protein
MCLEKMKGLFRKVLTIGFAVVFLVAIGSAFFNGNMVAYASGTIYIRANGLVEGTDKITNENNVIYTFTDDINDSIVVERSNIMIDGDEYALNGSWSLMYGFNLTSVSNVTIQNVNILEFGYAMWLEEVTQCVISNNTCIDNEGGIWLVSSIGNMVSSNDIVGSIEGVALDSSSGNIIAGNNITDSYNYGVYLISNSTGNTISGNRIKGTGNGAGIYLNESPDNVISGNDIRDSPNEHICLLYSSNSNTVSGNILANSTADVGVYVYQCSLNSFFGNNITSNANTGIRLDLAWDSTVSENNISENLNGIYLWYCSNITVSGNKIAENSQNGIYLEYSNENAILSNEIYSNPSAGIYLYGSSNNTIQENTNFSGWDTQYGIILWSYSHGNIVSENILSSLSRGIAMGYSDDNRILNNTVSNTEVCGIEIQQVCNNSLVANNVISNNSLCGIAIWPSDEATRYNVIQGNNISHNLVGIYILRLSGSVIYHNNFVDNTNQTSVSNSTNIWDDGYPSGGNYWSDYLTRYPSATEIDHTGIGDTAYEIDTNNTDHYPLMILYETTPPTITILSPENKTYAVNASIPLTFTVDEFASWMSYSLDGQANVTITENTTLPLLSDGWHYVTVYANDTFGNMGSATVYFTVDTTKPEITNIAQDPLINILPDTVVKINATVIDATSGIKQATLNYTTGDGTWISVEMTNLEGDIWNATIPAFSYGTNVTYVIIAEDIAGNIITTEQLGFECEYQVVPEFTLLTVIIALVIATSLIAIISRKKRTFPP